MNIRDYQFIKSIDSGSTTLESELISYFKIDASKLYKEVQQELIDKLNYTTKEISVPKNNNGKPIFIKINDRWYGIEHDFLDSSFEQYMRLESILSENNNYQNLHKLLSIYVRPVKRNLLYQKEIEPYDVNKQDDISKHLLEMEIGVAMGLLVFFYQSVMNSFRNIKIFFLNQQKMNQKSIKK